MDLNLEKMKKYLNYLKKNTKAHLLIWAVFTQQGQIIPLKCIKKDGGELI